MTLKEEKNAVDLQLSSAKEKMEECKQQLEASKQVGAQQLKRERLKHEETKRKMSENISQLTDNLGELRSAYLKCLQDLSEVMESSSIVSFCYLEK